MNLRTLFAGKTGGAQAGTPQFHTETVRNGAWRKKIAGIEIPRDICAFTTGTMGFFGDGSYPDITVRFEARRNLEEGGWDIRRFTDVPEGAALATGVEVGRGDAFMGHTTCDFDALRFLSGQSADRGFRAKDEGAGHGDMPHWKSVAEQAKQPIDKAGVVQPVVAGEALAENVIIDDPAQIALCDSTRPPAIVALEKRAFVPAENVGFAKRAFNACHLLLRPCALADAAERGDKEKIYALLACGADVNAKDKHDYTALMHAVIHDRKDLAQLLIDAEANVDAKGRYEQTALMLAAMKRCPGVDMLQLLIDAKADVNAKTSGDYTALREAARSGADMMQLLIEAKGNVNARGWFDQDLWMRDVFFEPVEKILFLIRAGADMRGAKDFSGQTTLSMVEDVLSKAEAMIAEDTECEYKETVQLLREVVDAQNQKKSMVARTARQPEWI